MSLKVKSLYIKRGLLIASIITLSSCSTLPDLPSINDIGNKVDPIPGSSKLNSKLNSNSRIQHPKADSRGVITYPNYQIIVANRSDTISSLANRIGISAQELADYNGLKTNHEMRNGEVLAIPRHATRTQDKKVQPIEMISETPIDDISPRGAEPKRHIVHTGETAYTVARLYGTSVTSLSSLNGLDKDLNIHTGQQLMIPVDNRLASLRPLGTQSITPSPPSSIIKLPKKIPVVVIPKKPAATKKTNISSAQFIKPINGSVLRGFSSKTEGIDYKASEGTIVKAAGKGSVALTSSSVNGTSIILIRHADGLYTVYSNISNPTVKKGTKITQGQTLGKVGPGSPPFIHFEVRRGTEAVDPTPFL